MAPSSHDERVALNRERQPAAAVGDMEAGIGALLGAVTAASRRLVLGPRPHHRLEASVERLKPPADGDEGGTARVNLRLSAHLKARAEEAASREGLSVNAWLVRAVSAAVDGGTQPRTTEKTRTVGQSFTGWVR